jgi:pectate lyase
MKFSTIFALGLSLLSELAVAAPSKVERRGTIIKRASPTDVASVGYATLNGGTTGGKGGSTVTVTTLADLEDAVSGDDAAIVIVSGTISGAAQVRVGSNKTILGKNSSAVLSGIGLYIKDQSNVIVRNLTIKKVLADYGDAIGIQASTNVWVDHCDVSSDRDHDKDYYDGLIDITHACDWVSVTNTFLHDHWKASLVGHSDSNGDEDSGHLTVTYANNYWYNINSRMPSFRFGTGHVFNSYFLSSSDGVNTRDGAQLLVESNNFDGVDDPLYSTDAGYAVSIDNIFTGGENEALEGDLSDSDIPYSYTLLGSANVKAAVYGTAGATLSF